MPRRRLKATTVQPVIAHRQATYVLRWKDPTTGRMKQQATDVLAKKSLRYLAQRRAGAKEEELAKATAELDATTWSTFRGRYEREHLSGLADKTREAWHTAASRFEEIVLGVEKRRHGKRIHRQPLALVEFLDDIDGGILSAWIGQVREDVASEATVATYLRTLLSGLRWAKRVGLLAEVPVVTTPRRSRGQTKTMRSRPITGEEFDRMVDATTVVRQRCGDAALFRDLLRGLWTSGLRIEEACILSWDWDATFAVDVRGDAPLFRILAEGQKSHRDELLPMVPEFAEILNRTPEEERRGRVFPIAGWLSQSQVEKIIRDFGHQARIVVNRDGKHASAHDLRRSFGTRWAGRGITPAELRVLMRHKRIETTMAHYVDIEARDLSRKLAKLTPDDPISQPREINRETTPTGRPDPPGGDSVGGRNPKR